MSERLTLVAGQRQRVAAAHLLRYAADDTVGEHYRDGGEIRCFLVWPEAPYWPDSTPAGDLLAASGHGSSRRPRIGCGSLEWSACSTTHRQISRT